MRLFIASPVLLNDYTALRADFSEVLDGKWVEEENLHLTWIFLGEQSSTDLLEEMLHRLTPLETKVPIVSVGNFGRPPRILHARSREKLLYNKASEFREAGFELTRFAPHITLCRIKRIYDYKRFKELKKSYREKMLGEILPEITLYESVLTKERAYYKKIESVTK